MAKKTSSPKWYKRQLNLPGSDGALGKQVKGPKPVQKLNKYFADSWSEMKRVTWPSRKETIRLTIGVLVFSVVITGLIFLLDYLFSSIVERYFI